MMMKGVSVLLLAFCCGLLEAQIIGPDHGGLTSLTQDRLDALEKRLEASEKEVSQLKSLAAAQPVIAFSVALMDEASIPGDFGPFAQTTVIPYKKIFANVGNGYNPLTGTFTAAVRGMYFFSFTMFTSGVPDSVACIRKNNVFVVCLWDIKQYAGNDASSNSVTMPLVPGDRVNVMLEATRKINDNQSHFNTFTGFLLFPF